MLSEKLFEKIYCTCLSKINQNTIKLFENYLKIYILNLYLAKCTTECGFVIHLRVIARCG
jgi:hypothetical protein